MTRQEKWAIRSAAWSEASSRAGDRPTQEQIYRGIVDKRIPTKGQRRPAKAVRPKATDRPAPTPPAPKPEPKPTPDRMTFTNAPEEWHGRVLYDWGQKGLRVHGNTPVKTAHGRPRKTFDRGWLLNEGRITVPNPALVRAVKAITPEVWPVKVRKGRYWQTRYYIAPQAAIDKAQANGAPWAEAEAETEDVAIETAELADDERRRFGSWLTKQGWAYVAVDAPKVASLATGSKPDPFDFLIYSDTDSPNLLVQLVQPANIDQQTTDNLDEWERRFGPGFAGALVWRQGDQWVAVTLADFVATRNTNHARSILEVLETIHSDEQAESLPI